MEDASVDVLRWLSDNSLALQAEKIDAATRTRTQTHPFVNMLLEVTLRDVFSAAPNAFLCEMTVSLKVSSAIEQIAQICRLRSQLSKRELSTTGSSDAEASDDEDLILDKDDPPVFGEAHACRRQGSLFPATQI